MLELDNIKQDLPKVKENLIDLGSALKVDAIRFRLDEINTEITVDGFWDDQEAAQKLIKEKNTLEKKLSEYDKLLSTVDDLYLTIEMVEEEESAGSSQEEIKLLVEDALNSYEALNEKAEELRLKTLLNGEFDQNNAIVSIHAGTGGVDAMDWAEMLLRMYTRWADKHEFKLTMLDLQDDTEAGIKSATLMMEGENAYGYMKNEHGVHRLVRISPFNAQGKRQTSFAMVEVVPELNEDIEVDIDNEDLRIDTYRSSGAGGQHVNKTDSAIRITHIPTGIVVTCQNERSQFQNKDMAMRMLKAKLMDLAIREHKENIKELKGDFKENTWGSQIRNYVFQPYTLVKDVRTGAEVSNVQSVMDGDIDYFINEMLKLNQ